MVVGAENSTTFQQFWFSKLMGFDYEIQYKCGKENKAADALSRVQGLELLFMAISLVDTNLETLIKQSYHLDDNLITIVEELQDKLEFAGFSLRAGLLRKHKKIVVGPNTRLRNQLIHWQHASPEGGHSGRDLNIRRIRNIFHWKGLNKHVRQYIRECVICQTSKPETVASPGLLQPLPIPEKIWYDIAMDFITGLPKSMGKEVILVVVDRLSKYSHFMALAHPYTAIDVAQVYLDNVFKLHGWPRSIVSDRDPFFLSNFWKGLFSLHGTEFLMSSYHLKQMTNLRW